MTATILLWASAGALSLALLAAGWRFGAMRAAFWATLGVVGQGASLSLIKAGPLIGYQHFRSVGDAMRERPVALALALLVVLAGAFGVVRRWHAITGWFAVGRRKWIVLFALAAGSVLAASPSESVSAYARELVFAATLQLAILACVACAVASLPDEFVNRLDDRLARFLAPADGGPRLDGVAWTLAAFVSLTSTVLCLTSYQALPHIPDEIAYLFQARYFADGLPWVAAPPVPAAFDTFLLEVSGDRWYGVFPPGWPLVLAVGVKLGVPFLVNPLLGGLCILLTYLFVQELGDRGTARLSAALLAFSPWHLTISMSYMSHALSLALALITAIGATRACRTGSWRAALVAGLSLGILGMSRPLEGVAVGLLAGIPILVSAIRSRRPGAVIGGGFGVLLTGGLGLAYNRMITGSLLLFPAERLFDREYGPGRYGIGFGPGKGVDWGLDPFPGHGPIDVVVNSVLNGFMVNVDLFGWATGSIAIVMLGFIGAPKGLHRLMAIALAVVVALHGAYWFSGGPDFGARYWYLIIVPCVVLAARALMMLDGEKRTPAGARPIAAAVLLSLSALVVFLPWRGADKYRTYRGIRPDFMTMSRDERFRDALILVRGRRHPEWAAATLANERLPGSSSAPVFAWDRDEKTRQALMAAFPTRTIWLVQGPSVESGPVRVIAGPVAPGSRSELPPNDESPRSPGH